MGELTWRRTVAVTAVCLAAALGSGCSGSESGNGSGNGNGTPTTSTEPAPAGAAAKSPEPTGSPTAETRRAEHIDGESVTKAPQVFDGEVIAEVADARGNGVVPLKDGVGAGPVSIAVNCQGEGTLTVELKPTGLSFPLECVAGEVSSTYNQFALKRARADAVLQVTAGSQVRWALSVGQ
ncbi:hypothetical protein [Streptomyces sp. NPDC018693]|uniref:hypothetical protein n=1 Tax=unclassified Streptomyces TaxID=2593676 RepID=UPI0037B91FD4